jgi:hypothetical protein
MSGQKCILRMNVRGRKGRKERVTGQGEFSMVLKSSDVVQPTANLASVDRKDGTQSQHRGASDRFCGGSLFQSMWKTLSAAEV